MTPFYRRGNWGAWLSGSHSKSIRVEIEAKSLCSLLHMLQPHPYFKGGIFLIFSSGNSQTEHFQGRLEKSLQRQCQGIAFTPAKSSPKSSNYNLRNPSLPCVHQCGYEQCGLPSKKKNKVEVKGSISEGRVRRSNPGLAGQPWAS